MSSPIPSTNELKFFSGCLCCFTALYPQFPDCIGCTGDCECLCVSEKFCVSVAGLKTPFPVGVVKNDAAICEIALFCCDCALKKPSICCKSKVQECCLVGAGAIPCTDDVPSVFGTCFVSCYPGGVKVFKPMSEITSAAGAPETDMEMTRA